MANNLTGDYEIVVQFTAPAINRVLAGMHRGNRFPHSMSVRVDDTPQSKRSTSPIVAIDGGAITDPFAVHRAVRTGGLTGIPPGDDILTRLVDPIVNANSTVGREVAIEVFSHLRGIAFLQLGAPTIRLPADGSASATVTTPVRLHYLPDPHTMPLPEFMRGEIVTAVEVRSITSSNGLNYIHVGLSGRAGNIRFNQIWPPKALPADPLTGEQLDAVNQALRNTLARGFQPSTSNLPEGYAAMDFKSLGPQVAAGLMSLSEGGAPNPDSVETVFIHGGDHFALAVNGDLVTESFAKAVNGAIHPRRFGWDTRFDWVTGTWFLFTRIFVLNATVQLQDATNSPFATPRILVTIPVQVRFGWKDKPTIIPDLRDFDFTISHAFTLSVNGGQVELQRLGVLEFNPSNLREDIRKQARTLFDTAWNSQQGQIQQSVTQNLSVSVLQKFLRDLMNPPVSLKADTPEEKLPVVVQPQLTYSSAEIRSSGIVVHGQLALPSWPAPHVEFELDPWTADTPTPKYSALNSWIQGGAIEEYIWSYRGNARSSDPNTFLSDQAPAIGWAPNSVCLMVKGTRVTSSGPVALERVSVSQCKGLTFPKGALKGFRFGQLPDIALRQPDLGLPNPGEVVAHASPWAGPSENRANLLVHFPDRESALHLDLLTRALERSGRTDTVTAIICALAAGQAIEAQPVDGVMFADDAGGWERLFDVGHRPASVLVSPSGEVVWRHQGTLTRTALAAVLKKHLARGGYFVPQFLESTLSIGQRAPNFLFEAASGRQLTLRKLAGRPVVLLFWKSSSKPGLETFRMLHKAVCRQADERAVILAINDSEDGELARGLAAEQLSAVIVPDPERQIARAYGVRLWPTTLFLDADGMVEKIYYGQIPKEELLPPTGSKEPEPDQLQKEY